ncbi:hypothetical protein CXB51_003888 [Gossypium anomalum]|uniref:Uncharacterized protein n=1 Tax=Gossypium anomalum TaxID=47600 RepID=A0A8J5ZQ10_9ROSI|nr:hypothetical protein CXB51_003888 [Gossypium anomalum]
MEFSKNSSSSRFSLGFSGDMNMEGDTKIMALIQLAGISVLLLFKLVFDCIKRRNRPTVTSNRLATISGEAEVDPECLKLLGEATNSMVTPHGAVGTIAVVEGMLGPFAGIVLDDRIMYAIVVYKIIFLPFLPSHILVKFPSEIFSTNLKDNRLNPITIYLCRTVWSEQEEEGFKRTTAAAMTKKISVTKKALIPGSIKPSRMSKEKYLLIFRISVLILNSRGRIFPLQGENLISPKFSIRLLKGRCIPGKILLTRRFSQNDAGTSDDMDKSVEGEVRNTNNCDGNTTVNKLTSSNSRNEDAAHEVQNSAMGTRTTDSARVKKFTKELSGQMVILEAFIATMVAFLLLFSVREAQL